MKPASCRWTPSGWPPPNMPNGNSLISHLRRVCVDALEQRAGIGWRARLRLGNAPLDRLVHLGCDRIELLVRDFEVDLQPRPEPGQRVACLELLEQLPRDVGGVVVHGVA